MCGPFVLRLQSWHARLEHLCAHHEPIVTPLLVAVMIEQRALLTGTRPLGHTASKAKMHKRKTQQR